jgi:L-cysteine:1D-myo-inositol 2-amino-2-deoxy-alpha-D-glucopyranoside ligase
MALLEHVRDRLADDLDTSAVLAAVDRWARLNVEQPGSAVDPAAPDLVSRMVNALLGVKL